MYSAQSAKDNFAEIQHSVLFFYFRGVERMESGKTKKSAKGAVAGRASWVCVCVCVCVCAKFLVEWLKQNRMHCILYSHADLCPN